MLALRPTHRVHATFKVFPTTNLSNYIVTASPSASYKNKYWPARAPTTTRTMAVYLLVNLYNAESVSMYRTAATELFEIVFKRSSTEGFAMNPGKLTLASSRSAATIATTPITAPHIPSKNAANVYKSMGQFRGRRHRYLVSN